MAGPITITESCSKNIHAYTLKHNVASVIAGLVVGGAVQKATDCAPLSVAAGATTTVVTAEACACLTTRKFLKEEAEEQGYKILKLKTPMFGEVLVKKRQK